MNALRYLSRLPWFWLLLGLTGCSQDGPLPPLAPDQLVPALERAFQKAKPELQAPAGEIISALKTNDQSKAFVLLQDLALHPGLANSQSRVIRRCLITLHDQMAARTPPGGPAEAGALEGYHSAK